MQIQPLGHLLNAQHFLENALESTLSAVGLGGRRAISYAEKGARNPAINRVKPGNAAKRAMERHETANYAIPRIPQINRPPTNTREKSQQQISFVHFTRLCDLYYLQPFQRQFAPRSVGDCSSWVFEGEPPAMDPRTFRRPPRGFNTLGGPSNLASCGRKNHDAGRKNPGIRGAGCGPPQTSFASLPFSVYWAGPWSPGGRVDEPEELWYAGVGGSRSAFAFGASIGTSVGVGGSSRFPT